MARVIGKGRYATETYPDPKTIAGAAGAIVRMGFDNSTEAVTYTQINAFTPVLKTGAGPDLQVLLTDYTPGNVIVIFFAIFAEDGVVSGPQGSAVQILPTIDLGSGPRQLVTGNYAGSTAVELQGFAFVVPVPSEITATPVVGLVVNASGNDPSVIEPFTALLMVMEVNASFVTQLPTTFLSP